MPREGTVFVSVRDEDKPLIRSAMRDLEAAGFKIVATAGTYRYLHDNGINCAKVNKVAEGRPHIVDSMKNGGVQLVINTTEGQKSISDSRDKKPLSFGRCSAASARKSWLMRKMISR